MAVRFAVRTPSLRRTGPVALASGLALLGACAIAPPDFGGPSRPPEFDPGLTPPPVSAELGLRLQERAIVRGPGGDDLLRIRFAFRAYEGWIGPNDEHGATGTIWFALDDSGEPDVDRHSPAVITEYPPGTSATGFPFFTEYGRRLAETRRVPAAIVDVRGPIARDLRSFANPDGDGDESFRSEEQFALSMLAAWQETLDGELLHETHVARAWLRAIEAVDRIVRRTTDGREARYLLAGEDLGAGGAIRAAAIDERVVALAVTGWPLDRRDLEVVRWRRWVREARYDVLDDLAPLPWGGDRRLVSLFESTWNRPDPGCASCPGTGDAWRANFDYLTLREAGYLAGVETLVLVGDSDPRFPIDLEARVSGRAPTDGPAGLSPPHPVDGGGGLYGGATSVEFRGRRVVATPFEGLRYLRGRSTLASPEAAEAVLAWNQHVAGYLDVPQLALYEAIVDGNRRFDLAVREGNASIVDVEFRTLEIGPSSDSDFKWTVHQSSPEPVRWIGVPTRYLGHDAESVGWWAGSRPVLTGRNRIWLFTVRVRAGATELEHSLPVFPVWYLGDPAGRIGYATDP